MFKIEKKESFKWPVTVFVPKDGGGFHPGREFQCTFKLLPQSQMDTALDKLKADDVDLLRTLVLDWTGVQDHDGSEFPFSEENRDTFIDIPYVRTAMIKSYFA